MTTTPDTEQSIIYHLYTNSYLTVKLVLYSYQYYVKHSLYTTHYSRKASSKVFDYEKVKVKTTRPSKKIIPSLSRLSI